MKSLRGALLVLAIGFGGTACKEASSSLNEYEKAEYAGKDICVLMKDEAARSVREQGKEFMISYRDIFEREKKIFALLVPKARVCSGQRAPVEGRTPSAPPPGADVASASGADAPGTPPVDAGAMVPPTQDPECEGLTDSARYQDLQAKEQQMRSCDPDTTTIEPPTDLATNTDTSSATATDASTDLTGSGAGPSTAVVTDTQPRPSGEQPGVEPLPEEQQFQEQTAFSLTGESAAYSELCRAMGIDDIKCKGLIEGGITMTKTYVDSLCKAAGAYLKAQELGKYDSAAMRDCGAEIVQDICMRNSAIVSAIAKSADDATKQLNEKIQKMEEEAFKQMGKSFMNSVMKCGIAVGTERVKKELASATEEAAVKFFTGRFSRIDKFMEDKRTKAVVSAACAVGVGIAGATIGKYEAQDVKAECKDIWPNKKQRAQACIKALKETGCDALSGKVDLAASFHAGDELSAARMMLDVTSGVVEAGCKAGAGTAGSALCSVIAKSGGYIADAFRGKSNPWADCLGTPAMGACVADYWHHLSTGVKVEDYKVGVAESKKKEDTKYYNEICWCWRKCMSNDWGTDREISRHLYWEMATKGDAGLRFCAAKERELKWPEGLTWENGRRKVYIQYTSCEVAQARGPDTNLWDDKGYMEIFVDGKWQWYQFLRTVEDGYMGCGGRTDGGT